MQYPFIKFGSPDSLDEDLHVIIDAPVPQHEAIKLCKEFTSSPTQDINLLVVKNGVVVWSHKGSADEVNNGIFYTYCLHDQLFPNPIKELVSRNDALKCVKTIRYITSLFSRTELRKKVKHSLRSNVLADKKEMLYEIIRNRHLLTALDVDGRKRLAFQLGQTAALLMGNEVYTKGEVVATYPMLAAYIHREHTKDLTDLLLFLDYTIGAMISVMTQDNGVVVVNGTYCTMDEKPYSLCG